MSVKHQLHITALSQSDGPISMLIPFVVVSSTEAGPIRVKTCLGSGGGISQTPPAVLCLQEFQPMLTLRSSHSREATVTQSMKNSRIRALYHGKAIGQNPVAKCPQRRGNSTHLLAAIWSVH